MIKHFVSASCQGESCVICGDPATHKVAEEFQFDEPSPLRHPFTNYLCCQHFCGVMGPVARRNCGLAAEETVR